MTGKLIFFDLDGTLLNHEKQLPDSTVQAIRQLKENGHEVAIATGRGPFMHQWIREKLDIDSYVSFNGQYVLWKGEVIATNPISPPLLQSVTDYAAERNHPIVYMCHEAMKCSQPLHAHVVEAISTLRVEQPPHEPLYYKGREIYQCLLFCTAEEEADYSEQFGELDFVRWHQFSTDIVPGGGSKARGIARIVEKLKMDPREVYAFGDALNDLEMLQYVGHGVAMGNAADVVKQAARYVTKDADKDGIEFGLRMLKLI